MIRFIMSAPLRLPQETLGRTVPGFETAPFVASDTRAIGHWLRDKNAPQELPRGPHGAVPAGAANARGDMARRYSQGTGRVGEREEQISVRLRLEDVADLGPQQAARDWERRLFDAAERAIRSARPR